MELYPWTVWGVGCGGHGSNATPGRLGKKSVEVFLTVYGQESDSEEEDKVNGYPGVGGGASSGEALDDKVRKLELDKENLGLQVSVLSDQIDAQVNKIRDLEGALASTWSSRQGGPPQDSLENELLSKSSFETHKLDLMAENSNLKLRLATVEREKHELEDRLCVTEKRLDDLQSRINEKTMEVTDLRSRVAKNGTIPGSPPGDHTDFSRDRTIERERTIDRLKRKHNEVEKLKRAVETLMADNSEKDSHIEELKNLVKKYRRIEELVLSTQQGKKGLEYLILEDDQSDSGSTHNSNTSGQDTVREASQLEKLEIVEAHDVRTAMFPPNATSTPVIPYGSPKTPSHSRSNGSSHTMTPPSTIATRPSSTAKHSVGVTRSSSFEEMKPPSRSPAAARRQGFGTLPKDAHLNVTVTASRSSSTSSHTDASRTLSSQRQTSKTSSTSATLPKGSPRGKPPVAPGASPSGGGSGEGAVVPPPGGSRSSSSTMPRKHRTGFMSFGKGFFKLRTGKWSSSAPNLAETETDEEALKDEMARQYKELQTHGQEHQKKKHRGGFKRFFGKLRRTNSQDLDSEPGEFKRGGVRSTAGPRLGWSKDFSYKDIEVPFPRWDTDRVALWLHSMGLSMYVGDCRRWVKNGDQLLKASPHDLEKELGMRNFFHKKKLNMALQAVRSRTRSAMDELDYNWVTRWMDDIGLPQYKDSFSEARIDGRMLHFLTVDDLVSLKVTNALHHLSIKRAIQVLRMNMFNSACLKRRPGPDEQGPLQDCPEEVLLWTNHRVMEWLRSIDLSEYAANLRGSGVHGGLMVLEHQFGAEIFASLLSIPVTKTLLRRHLSTHFVALIGQTVQVKKREQESQQGFIPLTPNQKVKVKKRLFSHRRTRSEAEEDYVCPLNLQQGTLRRSPQQNGTPSSLTRHGTLPKEEKEHMLSGERFLDDVPTSDV